MNFAKPSVIQIPAIHKSHGCPEACFDVLFKNILARAGMGAKLSGHVEFAVHRLKVSRAGIERDSAPIGGEAETKAAKGVGII